MTVRMYANIGPDMERHQAEHVSVHNVTADDIGTRCGGLIHDEPTDLKVQNAQGQMVVPICDLRLYLDDTTTARRLAEWLIAAANAIDSRDENSVCDRCGASGPTPNNYLCPNCHQLEEEYYAEHGYNEEDE